MHHEYYAGSITWVTALKHVLASHQDLVGGHRQLFEAGPACRQTNETLRNRGCQV